MYFLFEGCDKIVFFELTCFFCFYSDESKYLEEHYSSVSGMVKSYQDQ